MSKPGDRIGEYVLDSRIGSGTFGEVWKAHHHVWVDRIVAAKLLRDPTCLRSLEREGRLIDQLNHPNIVRPVAFDPYATTPYLVSEFVDGASLRAFVTAGLSPEHAVRIVIQVLTGLVHVHARGIIHRDLKPENILVERSARDDGFARPGCVKIADFGVGRDNRRYTESIQLSPPPNLPGEPTIAGTPMYLAPEVWSGTPADAGGDVYACGVILFELLTGTLPPAAAKPSDVVPTLPPEVDDIYRRACGPLEHRFASAEEMRQALRSLLDSGVLQPSGTSAGSGSPPWRESLRRSAADLHRRLDPASAAPRAVKEARAAVAGVAGSIGDLLEEIRVVAVLLVAIAAVVVPFLLMPAEKPKLTSETSVATDSGQRTDVTSSAPQTITSSVGIELVHLPPGEYLRGSLPDEPGRGDDETQHRVRLTRGFYIGATEVTQLQWTRLMGEDNNPSDFNGWFWASARRPVDSVSWEQAMEFCQRLTLEDRIHNRIGREWFYRLPTEAEWEYACRAGRLGIDSGALPLDQQAWSKVNSDGKTARVAFKKPNPWGLYDMQGNVWEWCMDWYGPYPSGPVTDPTGPESGQYRVLRGGCWVDDAINLRAAKRFAKPPDSEDRCFGFRVVLEPR